MPKRRFGTFTGGIDLPDEKAATLNAPIVPIGRLERLLVPLAPVNAEPAEPVVEAGHIVDRGETIARAGSDGQVNVHAPLRATVGEGVEVMLPDDWGGWRASAAMELTDPAAPADVEPMRPAYEWQAADGPSLRHRIAEGDLLTSAPPVRPLAEWIQAARAARVDVLIANVMENTPLVTAEHRLLAERGTEAVRGLAILARAVEAGQVMLAVDQRRTDSYRPALGPAELYGIDAIALAHKYPIGADPLLVKILTRRAVPPGRTTFHVGVAVVDAATCWAAYRWTACGERQTARVVTVSGDYVRKRGNYLTPFGAAVEEVLDRAQAESASPAIHGSAMTGRGIVGGAVVSASSNALLAPHLPPSPPPTACIRCGWCVENCPARLNVAELNDDFELGRAARARRRGVLACLGCGICSYVCPARLPLAHRMSLLIQAIRRRRRRAAHGPTAHSRI